MIGDQALFTRSDGIERLWEISVPLLGTPAGRAVPPRLMGTGIGQQADRPLPLALAGELNVSGGPVLSAPAAAARTRFDLWPELLVSRQSLVRRTAQRVQAPGRRMPLCAYGRISHDWHGY